MYTMDEAGLLSGIYTRSPDLEYNVVPSFRVFLLDLNAVYKIILLQEGFANTNRFECKLACSPKNQNRQFYDSE